MNENFLRILWFATGIILGGFFFGGLWLTVKKTFKTKNVGLLYFVSLIFRTSVTLMGFYYISQGNWQRLLFAMTGFIAARSIILRINHPANDQSPPSKSDALEIKS